MQVSGNLRKLVPRLLTLPAEHRKRHGTRFIFLERAGYGRDRLMKRLVHRTGGQAIQRVRDSGQLIHHLVGDGGTLQNNRSPAPELQDGPSRSCNENEYQRQKLLLSCDVYGSAEKMKRI